MSDGLGIYMCIHVFSSVEALWWKHFWQQCCVVEAQQQRNPPKEGSLLICSIHTHHTQYVQSMTVYEVVVVIHTCILIIVWCAGLLWNHKRRNLSNLIGLPRPWPPCHRNLAHLNRMFHHLQFGAQCYASPTTGSIHCGCKHICEQADPCLWLIVITLL